MWKWEKINILISEDITTETWNKPEKNIKDDI